MGNEKQVDELALAMSKVVEALVKRGFAYKDALRMVKSVMREIKEGRKGGRLQ